MLNIDIASILPISICKIFRLNDISIEYYISKIRSDKSNETILSYAAYHNQLCLVKWLYNRLDIDYYDILYTIRAAACSGNIEMVKWLCINSPKEKYDVVSYIADLGHTDIFIWLLENGYEDGDWFVTTIDHAAFHGYTDILEWLHNNITDVRVCLTAEKAVRGGQIKVLKWLYKKGYRFNDMTMWEFDTHIITPGIRQKQFDALLWIYNKKVCKYCDGSDFVEWLQINYPKHFMNDAVYSSKQN